ncbi:MAG: GIY-YIG nuclease family protein [Patescibacteria group bacterium]|jgi:excinuclease UvrABC nuclease subunit
MIPSTIKIKNHLLPDHPGVYFFKDERGNILYIGKATSLLRRVNSYFQKTQNGRLAALVAEIRRIDYFETPTVIEALVLEANQIKKHLPPFNILEKDDKSFLYLVITNEAYPKPVLMRAIDLERQGVKLFDRVLSPKTKKLYCFVFGPYTSGVALKRALEFLRRVIPWSTCAPNASRPCFYRQIGLCPGVCTGEISKRDYQKNIKRLAWFFSGHTKKLNQDLKKAMQTASDRHDFETAATYRNMIQSFEHVHDVALITKEDIELPFTQLKKTAIDILGRIEAYDISNISGTSAVGSMVVFEDGKPKKSDYRRFKIISKKTPDDVGMLEEMMRRRLTRAIHAHEAWKLPELFVIDGGEGQVNRVEMILKEFGLMIPTIGLAKGFDRKQDRLVFDQSNREIVEIAERGKEIFQRARNEAHRFAISYHRALRNKSSGFKRQRKPRLASTK